MKKTLLIAAAVAMSFVACSKEEIQTVGKGMTLSANVADDNTKATIDKNSVSGKWNFSWETGDVVAVTAPGGKTYNFVKPETGDFKCEEAEPITGTWSAVYPADFTTKGIDFTNQTGSLGCALERYYMTGSTYKSDASATLEITMSPKCAILKVTNNSSSDKYIYLNEAGTSKYYYKINSTGSLETTTKGNALLATVPGGASEFYIAIPVPTSTLTKVQLKVGVSDYNSARKISAGTVYNVTIH